MKNFLNQLDINPGSRLALEQFIFSRADQMLPGYRGGNWESKKIGNVWSLVLPTKDTRIALSTPFNTVTLDAASASIAFTFLIVSWFWEINCDRLSDAAQESLSEIKEALRDQMYSDANGFDQDSIFTLTD